MEHIATLPFEERARALNELVDELERRLESTITQDEEREDTTNED